MNDNLIKWLSITDRHSKMYMDHFLKPLGINSSQHMYIIKIWENPGITQDCFIGFFHIHPSNVARSIAFLEKNGFLTRKHNEKDKRTCRLYPTAKTEQAYTIIHQTIQELSRQLLSGFTKEEETLFLSLLQRTQWNALSLKECYKKGGNKNTYEYGSTTDKSPGI